MLLFNNFTDTIFLKEDSELEKKYEALTLLNKKYPNNNQILEELYMIKKGLAGENEIKYQLSKANLGLYVLHDVNMECDGLTAQIDYIIVTRAYVYFVECKNLTGNITINDRGEFIREYTYNDKTIKKGMYSPIRQVEAQRDVFKKLWNTHLSKNKVINFIKRSFCDSDFEKNYRILVVAANKETILNTKYAPKNIKDKVIKAEHLIDYLKQDLKKSDKTSWESKKGMESWAKGLLSFNVEKNIDYYSLYEKKFLNNKNIDKDKLKENLITFRKERAQEMNIPAYYVFTNEELDKLLELLPNTLDSLKESNILTPVKIKLHGEKIVEIIKTYII